MDELELRALSDRYARAVDDRDVERLREVFTREGSLAGFDPGAAAARFDIAGHEALAGVVRQLARDYRATVHQLGERRYRIDGDHATGEVHGVGHHLRHGDGAPCDKVLHFRYQDRYVRTAAGWRIERRELHVDRSDELVGPATPTLTLGLPTFGALPGRDWRSLLELARAAEAAGVDRVLVSDHVVNGPRVADYPWGRFPTGPDGDWLEPLTVLTAIAATTATVRLATGILIAPLRPAPLLAKTAATLDVLSGGRLDLGVGTGWQAEELAALGVDPAQRGQVLTDTMAACRALWAPGPATFASASVSFTDISCAPKPIQLRLPVWFSGTLTPRNVRRVVELGDGWIPIMGASTDEVRRGAAELRAAFEAAGRDPGELQVRAALSPVLADGRVELGATMAAVPELVAAGVTDLTVNLLALDRHLDDPLSRCEAAVAAFRAAVDR